MDCRRSNPTQYAGSSSFSRKKDSPYVPIRVNLACLLAWNPYVSPVGLYLARNTPSLATEKELLIAREAPYSWQYEEGQNSKLVPCYIISTSEGEKVPTNYQLSNINHQSFMLLPRFKKYLSINLQGDVWLSPNRPSFTAPAISESQLWLLASVRQNELLTLSQLEVRVEQAAGKDMATFLNMVLQKFVTLPTRSSFLSGDTLFV